MTYEETMSALKAAGSEQTRKTYIRHGADAGNLYGVSYAELYKLAKRAGTDQALAEKLWASGNHDARVLATHVADAAAISSRTLDSWMSQAGNYVLMDAVSLLVIRTPHAPAKAKAWTDSKQEFIAAAGWNVVAGLAMAGADASRGRVKKQDSPTPLDEAECAAWLARIERKIGAAANRAKHSMNNALISIGLRGGALREQAIAAARRIGKVEVDHGQTTCKTPDAIAYIQKASGLRPAAAPAKAAAGKPGKATKKPARPARARASR